jgi:hypothetical protein
MAMGRSWHTSEPLATAHAGHDQFVGGDHPARASAALRELIKALAREIATEDHLAEIEKREDR